MNIFEKETVNFLSHFMRQYPARSVMMVSLLAFAGILEGVGVATLLPLLELVAGEPGAEPSGLSQSVAGILGTVGLAPTLGVLLVCIVLAMTAKALFLWLAMRQVGFTVAQVTTDLRMNLLRALMGVRWSYYASQRAGRFGNAISVEAHRAAAAYREGCVVIAGLFQIGVYLAVAILVSWQMAVATLVIGAVFLWLLRGFVGIARDAGREQTELMRSLVSRLTDALRGIKPIRAMGREGHLQPLLEKETEGLNDSLRKQVSAAESLRLFQEPTLVVLIAFGLFAALSWGSQPFSSVMILAFIFYRIMTHANTLQTRYQTLVVGESAFWSIQEQVETAQAQQEQNLGKQSPPPLAVGVELDGITFAYDEEPVLDGLSLSIPTGSFVALYGPSGAGKTTIADLIVGFHTPARGAVRVDGVSLEEIDLRQWRQEIGYVPQEIFLFHDSIMQNVTLGDKTISEAEVEDALKAADAWPFVQERPEGIRAVIGEGGSMLSGGQRQRISIARALVHRPRLLILDEATASLDPATEGEILETMRKLGRDITIVAISHQPALRDAADVVYYLEKGRLVEVDRKAERRSSSTGARVIAS